MAETAPPTEARIARQHRHAALLARRAVEHVPPDLEYCQHCRAETDHYYVYWYTSSHVFPKPLRATDGTVIKSILTRTFASWCARHKGAPPLTYTDKPIPAGAWLQKQQTADGGKPDYEDATA